MKQIFLHIFLSSPILSSPFFNPNYASKHHQMLHPYMLPFIYNYTMKKYMILIKYSTVLSFSLSFPLHIIYISSSHFPFNCHFYLTLYVHHNYTTNNNNHNNNYYQNFIWSFIFHYTTSNITNSPQHHHHYYFVHNLSRFVMFSLM